MQSSTGGKRDRERVCVELKKERVESGVEATIIILTRFSPLLERFLELFLKHTKEFNCSSSGTVESGRGRGRKEAKTETVVGNGGGGRNSSRTSSRSRSRSKAKKS